jgi:hypothetical protein
MKLIKSEKPIFKNPEYLLINNWFTPEEEQRVWKELEFYTKTDSMERAENKMILQKQNQVSLRLNLIGCI